MRNVNTTTRSQHWRYAYLFFGNDFEEHVAQWNNADWNFTVVDKNTILQKVKQNYADGAQDFLDGVTVEYKDWWFNIRPSNTEPLLRLTIEADTKELLELKKKELSDFIKN